MGNINSDRHIMFTREQGCYLKAFRLMGAEVSFGQSCRPQSNRLFERMKDEYKGTLRILKTLIKSSNQVLLKD